MPAVFSSAGKIPSMHFSHCNILLEGLRFYAYHGVLPQERTVGGHYTVDLSLCLSDYEEAVLHDQLSGTVNYAEVYAVVEKEMAIPSDLLEHVAGRILYALFKTFPKVTNATVTLRKDTPPMGADLCGCSVVLEAHR